MSCRRALIVLMLATVVAASAAVAADTATARQQGPVRIATFTLSTGTMQVYLPADAATGRKRRECRAGPGAGWWRAFRVFYAVDSGR